MRNIQRITTCPTRHLSSILAFFRLLPFWLRLPPRRMARCVNAHDVQRALTGRCSPPCHSTTLPYLHLPPPDLRAAVLIPQFCRQRCTNGLGLVLLPLGRLTVGCGYSGVTTILATPPFDAGNAVVPAPPAPLRWPRTLLTVCASCVHAYAVLARVRGWR